jgi:hypothetical protein
VPIQTRCPSCGAALPVAAAWCSLCHSDLRPRTMTPSASSVLPGAPAPVPGGSVIAPVSPVEATGSTLTDPPRSSGRHSADRDLETETQDLAATYPDPDDPDEAPHGRRARPEDSSRVGRSSRVAEGRRSSGRHASGARQAPVVRDLSHLEPIEIPSADEATPEQVDAIAEQMLTRLAITEPRPRLLDPDDLPGGKWGVIAGGMLAVLVVLLAVGSLLAVLFNR